MKESIAYFLILKDSIPQYKKIVFPKLEENDSKEIYSEKIRNIAILFNIINSSLLMHESNLSIQKIYKSKR